MAFHMGRGECGFYRFSRCYYSGDQVEAFMLGGEVFSIRQEGFKQCTFPITADDYIRLKLVSCFF